MTIRQLEKQCDKEIQEACTKYTMPKLTEVTIAIHEKYAGLIADERKKEPPIGDLEGYGKFLENLALGSIKIEADILAAKERINDITNEELYVYTKQDGIARG